MRPIVCFSSRQHQPIITAYRLLKDVTFCDVTLISIESNSSAVFSSYFDDAQKALRCMLLFCTSYKFQSAINIYVKSTFFYSNIYTVWIRCLISLPFFIMTSLVADWSTHVMKIGKRSSWFIRYYKNLVHTMKMLMHITMVITTTMPIFHNFHRYR